MNEKLSNLPVYFIKGYCKWKKNIFAYNKKQYQNLAKKGQNPRAMVIQCCDSRLDAKEILGAEIGDLFVYRNIANMVPDCDSGLNDNLSNIAVLAALEYSVVNLQVKDLIVLGHSGCGGISHYLKAREKESVEKNQNRKIKGPIDTWLENLCFAYDRVCQHTDIITKDKKTNDNLFTCVERENIVVSLENLQKITFIKKAIEKQTLSLHGLWNDIYSGGLWLLDHKKNWQLIAKD